MLLRKLLILGAIISATLTSGNAEAAWRCSAYSKAIGTRVPSLPVNGVGRTLEEAVEKTNFGCHTSVGRNCYRWYPAQACSQFSERNSLFGADSDESSSEGVRN